MTFTEWLSNNGPARVLELSPSSFWMSFAALALVIVLVLFLGLRKG